MEEEKIEAMDPEVVEDNPVVEEQTPVVEEQVVEENDPAGSELRVYYAEKYPDKNIESDIDLMNDAAEELKAAHQELADYKEANDTLMDVLEEYPEFMEIIDDVKAGMDFRVALGKHFDPEDLRVEEDEDVVEDYRKVVEERKQRKQDAANRIAERENNWAETQKVFDTTREEIGWDEEKEEGFGTWLSDAINDIAMGKITPELMRKLRHGYIYEEAVAQAREDGEIEGKNAAIEAKRVKAAESSDNMPSGGAGATEVKEEIVDPNNPFSDVEMLMSKRNKKW